MSWSVQLFIGPGTLLGAVAHKVSQVLRLPLHVVDNGKGELLSVSGPDTYIEVYENVFVNDGELNFEDYAVVVTMWRNSSKDWKVAQDIVLQTAGRLFETFKEEGRYRLLLTEELHTLLQKF